MTSQHPRSFNGTYGFKNSPYLNYTTFRQLSPNRRFVSIEWRRLLLNNGSFVQQTVLTLDWICFVAAKFWRFECTKFYVMWYPRDTVLGLVAFFLITQHLDNCLQTKDLFPLNGESFCWIMDFLCKKLSWFWIVFVLWQQNSEDLSAPSFTSCETQGFEFCCDSFSNWGIWLLSARCRA
jgi:hypothetical protein